MSYPLERPALGQKVPLGTFYNAHTDTFQSKLLFSGALPAGTVDTSRHQKTSTALSYIDSNKGRHNLLGIDPEIGASLFSGLAPAGGSANCLREHRTAIGSLASVEYYSALHHQMTTAEDKLQLKNPILQEHITAACLQSSESTHVVTGIVWGCQTVIVARGMRPRNNLSPANDDTTEAASRKSFSDAMSIFRSAVDELQYVPDQDLREIDLTGLELAVSAYSELFNDGGMVLQNLKEAFNFIKLLPSLLKHSDANDGKGEQIYYCLLPIQTFASLLGYRDETVAGNLRGIKNIQYPIPHEGVNTVLKHFDDVEYFWSFLVDHGGYLARNKPYVPPNHVQEVEAVIKTVETELAELRQRYASLLTQGRMHGPNQPAMASLCDRLGKLNSYCTQILDLSMYMNAKIDITSKAVARGAIYVGHNNVDLGKILIASAASRRETYVFRFSQAAMTVDVTSWEANYALLDDLLEQQTTSPMEAAIILLDCDALGHQLDRAQIAHHDRQGKTVTQDLYEQRQFETDQSFARCIPGALETGDMNKKPVQRRKVKIPCPGIKCNSLEVCNWICSGCHSQIEFGYSDDYLYCDCGRAKFNAWQFKCNGVDHDHTSRGRKAKRNKNGCDPDGYVAYKNEAQLLSMLKSLEQTDYVNILILGETGVGKSTFINSLVNYLSFETLEEAKWAETLNWVIPCAFSIQTMDRSRPNGAIEERKIQVGIRDDEKDGSSGASATQQTAVYPVNIGSKTIRLIDTPGIGDTRGLAYDKKNMADILRTLSSYEQLHGILILLKSNNSRLTVTFNFCMQELLTHLHRSASRNMAFGFTNTRISNYSPGDTFGPLTTLLGKHRDIGLELKNENTFCFDSESFRFLAAIKNDIAMQNEEDFRRSWEHSREEAVRLVEYFESKTPHQVKSTLSLNGTRQLIAELTKPMANISQLINTNIKICGDQMDELRDTRLSGDKLRQRLQVPKAHLKTVKLDRPRTVCRNGECVEWRDDGTGVVVGIYKSPCHNPCYLDNVEVDRINCPELIDCAAINSKTGLCVRSECQHSWQEHLHVYFELEEYTAMVTDTEAQRLFEQNESDITVKHTALRELECRVAEYKEEHAKIQQSAAKFGIFLKKHSITPYNDATLEYLDVLIQEEEQKARVSRNKTKLDLLRRDYKAHIELVKTLEDSMAGGTSGDGPLDEAGVEAVVHDLYDLQHFGQMLRDVKEGLVDAHQSTYRERPFKVHGRNSTGRPSQMRQPLPPSSSQNHARRYETVDYYHPHGRHGDGNNGYDGGYEEYVLSGRKDKTRRQGKLAWVRSAIGW